MRAPRRVLTKAREIVRRAPGRVGFSISTSVRNVPISSIISPPLARGSIQNKRTSSNQRNKAGRPATTGELTAEHSPAPAQIVRDAPDPYRSKSPPAVQESASDAPFALLSAQPRSPSDELPPRP